jgi:hypothetical protein
MLKTGGVRDESYLEAGRGAPAAAALPPALMRIFGDSNVVPAKTKTS